MRVSSFTPPAASPLACVLNQLFGNTASGVPCSWLCWNSVTWTPATCSSKPYESITCRQPVMAAKNLTAVLEQCHINAPHLLKQTL
jgi:hypothetical protein